MTGVPERFQRPMCSWWLPALGLVVAVVVNLLSGADGAPVRGPGGLALQIAALVALLQWVIFRRPVWIDPAKREIRWSTLFGRSFGVWRFDEVTSVGLSNSSFRRPTRDTILLRVGGTRLSFEVPLGAADDVIEILAPMPPRSVETTGTHALREGEHGAGHADEKA